MTSAIDYREYENGVADVLRFIAGDGAEVRRDVRVSGRASGTARQVDVLVRGPMFGFADATLAVDCKRWKSKLDVADVEAFVAVLDDLGADLGMLMTTEGYTSAAKARAGAERGVRTEVPAELLPYAAGHERGAHGLLETAAIDRHLPLFVEKPLGRDLATAVGLAETSHTQGLLTAVG